MSWFEEVDGVNVGYVDTPSIGLRTLGPILLDVHTKEADVNSILLLKGEQSTCTIGEVVYHVTISGEKSC